MLAMPPIVTGILSYGMSGKVFHAPFLAENENFIFRAVVERSTKVAQSRYPNILSYTSVEALLADPEIELVVVNTPNDTHVEFAMQALKAGKHVLIEKPFAPTAAEAQALFDLGRAVGRVVLPYHNRRFDSDFKSLKYIVDKHLTGAAIELHLRFDRYRPEIGPKTFKETRKPAAGVMFDLGSHLLDQVISLFGKPKSSTKILSKNRDHSKVDDYGCLILNYSNGPQVFITCSLLVAAPLPSLVLHGTVGTFIKERSDVQETQLLAGIVPSDPNYGQEQDGQAGTLTVVHADKTVETLPVPSAQGSYMDVYDAVFSHIRMREPYYVTEEQILIQLEILSSLK